MNAFKRTTLLIGVALLASGCSVFKRAPVVDTCEYLPIPEALLQPCDLPGAPLANGRLSESFVIAMQCAQQGNADKVAIRELLDAER